MQVISSTLRSQYDQWAPGCSNHGNHLPPTSPWHLGSFGCIKKFPGVATVGLQAAKGGLEVGPGSVD